MKRKDKPKHKRKPGKPTARLEPRPASRRKAWWFLLLGVALGGGILTFGLAGSFWHADQASLKESGGEANVKEKRPQRRQEPSPGSAEPRPVPPEPMPHSADQATSLPETVAELKKAEVRVVERLMGDFPNSSDPIALMGMVHNEQGNTAEAIDCWHRSLELNRNRADVCDALGAVAQRRQEYEEAAVLFRKAAEINPKLFGLHFRLAQVLLDLGKAQEAVEALQEELRVYPQAVESHFLLGRTYLQLKEYENAKSSYQAAVKLQPDHTNAYYGLATACARLGQKQESREYMERFKDLKAGRLEGIIAEAQTADDVTLARQVVATTYARAGQVYHGHGKMPQAEQLWRTAARLDPKNVVCRRNLAQLYEASARSQDALRLCEELRKIDPENARYHLNAGVLYARVNRIHAALSALEQAMKLEPGNLKYRKVYERIRKRLP